MVPNIQWWISQSCDQSCDHKGIVLHDIVTLYMTCVEIERLMNIDSVYYKQCTPLLTATHITGYKITLRYYQLYTFTILEYSNNIPSSI